MALPFTLANGPGNYPDATQLMANYNYLNGLITALPSPIPTNLLINGGFEIWQRGTSFTNPANGTYICDRWTMYTNISSYTVTATREGTTIDGQGLYSMKIVTALVSADFGAVRQKIENAEFYQGKTISVSVRCKTSVANMCSLDLGGAVTTTSSSAKHSGGGGWETLTATVTVAANETALTLYMYIALGSAVGTSYWDNAMLCISPSAVGYSARPTAHELILCQRYYEVFASNYYWSAGTDDSGNYGISTLIRMLVTKRVAPTVTLTMTAIREEASATNVVGSYTAAVEQATIDNVQIRAYKGRTGAKPNYLNFSFVADAEM